MAVEVLQKMKDILTQRGWGKGTLYDPHTGKCCVIGSWALATETINPDDYGQDYYPKEVDVYEEFKHAQEASILWDCAVDRAKLDERIKVWMDIDEDDPSNLWEFNDADPVKVDDVIEVIDCAILKSKA
jgi:hypothetical protein